MVIAANLLTDGKSGLSADTPSISAERSWRGQSVERNVSVEAYGHVWRQNEKALRLAMSEQIGTRHSLFFCPLKKISPFINICYFNYLDSL